MNIIEAFKTGKKVKVIGREGYFIGNDLGVVFNSNGCVAALTLEEILSDRWAIYHREIVPMNHGEMWTRKGENGNLVAVTVRIGKEKELSICFSNGNITSDYGFMSIAHGKNGWTRVYPMVEEYEDI